MMGKGAAHSYAAALAANMQRSVKSSSHGSDGGLQLAPERE